MTTALSLRLAVDEVAEVLAELQAQGVSLRRVGDRLRLRPADRASADLLARIQVLKPALLIEHANAPAPVRERARAMLAQIPAKGPIRFLIFRDGAWLDEPGRCASCGDPIAPEPGRHYICGAPVRCNPCAKAARLAIEAARVTARELRS